MVNIIAFIAALRTTWLRKITTVNNSPWSIILQFMTDTKNVFNLGTYFLKEKTRWESLLLLLTTQNKKNKFWRDVFSSHIQIVAKNTPTEMQQFQTIALPFSTYSSKGIQFTKVYRRPSEALLHNTCNFSFKCL